MSNTFIEWFRASAPYVHAHRGKTFVVTFGGEAIESAGFGDLVHDLALLHGLGVKLVLVPGARPQIERRLAARSAKQAYAKGRRVTDTVALACAKEAVGTIRIELEARFSAGLPGSPMAGARIRLSSGNFVVARPIGVIDGVDMRHSGEVRRIDAEAIRQRLDSGTVVVVPPLGYSVTGEVFNLASPDVAAATASALHADKLVCLVESRGVLDAESRLLGELTPAEAEAILARARRPGEAERRTTTDHERRSAMPEDVRRHLEAAVRACRAGVRRAHLVSRQEQGALLTELFSRDGAGTLVTAETFDDVRAARIEDLAGIWALVAPLQKTGVLAARSRERLADELERFTVVEREGLIIACAALVPFTEHHSAEIASVVVHPDYRDSGRGEVLLQYLERRAKLLGLERLFLLTTRTAHWFRERGFEPGSIQRDVPPERRRKQDPHRRSKVFVKKL